MSQPEPSDVEQPKRRWNWVSVALFVIGLLILVPSGLCIGLGGIIALNMGNTSELAFVLMIGGLPAALGALLVWLGLATRQRE